MKPLHKTNYLRVRSSDKIGRTLRNFKSITVNKTTFEAVDRLSETLLPRVKLSKAQVVENLVKGSHEKIINNKKYHGTEKRHTEDTQGT